MYRWGIALAVLAGVCNYLGHVFNKLEVNRDSGPREGPGFFTRLLHRPLWITGVVLQIGVGSVFFLLAQAYVGPVLIPGLMATGFVVLVLGSAWLVREAPGAGELMGILCLILSAVALGYSRLRIDLATYDVLAARFLLRAAAFSLVVAGLFLTLQLLQLRRGRHRGSLLALASGLLYVLSNFWVGPFMAVVLRLLRGELTLPVLGMFAFASAVLVLTNLFGIALLQRAFQLSKASTAVPLQTAPTQIAPAAVYLLVFRLPPPAAGSLPLFTLAVALILGSSFLLAGRQDLSAAPGGLRARSPGPCRRSQSG